MTFFEVSDQHRFYDQGWNDRCKGKPLCSSITKSYRDGWMDCDGLPESERKPMGSPND